MNNNVIRKVGVAASVVLTVVIIFFSLERSSCVPHVSWIPFGDKGAHACAYGALGFSMGLWCGKSRKRFLQALFVMMALGISLELIQPLFGRCRELLDVVADVVGGAFGLGFLWLLRRVIARD